MRKVALITGGTSGIGFEAAKRMIAQGCDLHLVYRSNHQKAKEAVEHLQKINSEARIAAEPLDLSDTNNCTDFADSFMAKYKNDTLNTFISCHGQMLSGLFIQKKIDSVLKLISEHLLSNVILMHHLLPKMCVQKYGRVVFLTSLSSHKINKGLADYALSKAALETFVKSLTAEYSHRNITFNCICAGLVNTRTVVDIIDKMSEIKQGSIVAVEQVADLIELLTSEKSSNITGSTFLIDGGQYCMNNNQDHHKLSFYSEGKKITD